MWWCGTSLVRQYPTMITLMENAQNFWEYVCNGELYLVSANYLQFEASQFWHPNRLCEFSGLNFNFKINQQWLFVNSGIPRISCDGSIYGRNLRSRHQLLRYSFRCKCHQRIEEVDTIYRHQNRQWAKAWRGNRCIKENVIEILSNWMTMWGQFSNGIICDQKCRQVTHYSACMI